MLTILVREHCRSDARVRVGRLSLLYPPLPLLTLPNMSRWVSVGLIRFDLFRSVLIRLVRTQRTGLKK